MELYVCGPRDPLFLASPSAPFSTRDRISLHCRLFAPWLSPMNRAHSAEVFTGDIGSDFAAASVSDATILRAAIL